MIAKHCRNDGISKSLEISTVFVLVASFGISNPFQRDLRTNSPRCLVGASLSLPYRPRRRNRQLAGYNNGPTVDSSGHFSLEGILPQLDPITPTTPTTPTPPRANTSTLWHPLSPTHPPPSLYHHAPSIPVVYTNDPDTIDKWLCDNIPTHNSCLGFDVEFVPSTPWLVNHTVFEGPATVQLATPHATLVAHLTRSWGSRRSSTLAPLASVLNDATIMKIGSGIDDDMLRLYRWNKSLNARCRFDIAGVGASPGNNPRRVGLKRLVRGVLGVDFVKSRRIATSNWSRTPLSPEQIIYSARDAWAGAAVYEVLADRDPARFGFEGLQKLMMESHGRERSMWELDCRDKMRQHAKRTLKEIRMQFREYGFLANYESHVFPDALRDEIIRLEIVLEKMAPDKVTPFDIESLGIFLRSNNET